ncbi:MAG: MotA/TolQ/ExbB proton channel family protein [Oligoflexia bacterium]|nr:MotA/TolQ/ExbB proton channel family protein [Oligoflexia bacterium]
MLSQLFLSISLVGSEWVLYLLVGLSILSFAVIFERFWFYREANRGIAEFRETVRKSIQNGRLEEAQQTAEKRLASRPTRSPDLETEMVDQLVKQAKAGPAKSSGPEILGELARDSVVRSKLNWDRNLSVLATIGSNAPFIGLFGTVLGIIKAFHDLSHQTAGAQAVTAGISEALVATAFGLLVAIPAVVAFNIFQRKVKAAMAEAEALKSFLIGNLSGK